ncbi:MAG: signal recognition particle-docking protein FtsY [Bacteroidetes bacterium]|nr:signal recognition particle-docking protein FtsY [Bacteroidota bacterium]
MMKAWWNKTDESKRLEQGLEKTRQSMFGRLHSFLLGKRTVDDAFLDELEEILIAGDVGVKTSLDIIDRLKTRVAKETFSTDGELFSHLHMVTAGLLSADKSAVDSTSAWMERASVNKPHVILIVGVNGVGKTTTIGKLAAHFKSAGSKVVIGAADTFRAAASEQLAIWATRSSARFITHQDGADPAAVAFDTVQSAVAQGEDVVLIDTAGRLHNKTHLMEELNKIERSISKVIPSAPHDVWLVLDASTGQNAMVQAREFSKVTRLTGLVLTKLDGTAKGGIVLSVCHELKTPVRFIGIGEKMDDLRPFDPDVFVSALFDGLENAR